MIRSICLLCDGSHLWEGRLCPCCGGTGFKLWRESQLNGPTVKGIDRLIDDILTADKAETRKNYYF